MYPRTQSLKITSVMFDVDFAAAGGGGGFVFVCLLAFSEFHLQELYKESLYLCSTVGLAVIIFLCIGLYLVRALV